MYPHDETETLPYQYTSMLGQIAEVVMVVHQPRYSLFTLFDNVLLLGMGGRTVYLGESTGALPYFRDLGFKMPEHERLGGAGTSYFVFVGCNPGFF